jgi:hypothetical protein
VRIVRADGQIRLVFLKSTLLPADVTMEVLTATNPADGFAPIPAGEVVQLGEQSIRHHPNAVEVTLGFSNPAWTADPARFFRLRFSAAEP